MQQEIGRIISETCDVTLERDAIGIDGCSVPTFALPLAAVATGFARLASGRGLEAARAEAARRLMEACFAAPDLVAGEGRFDTIVMRGLPRAPPSPRAVPRVSIARRCRRLGSALPSRSTTAPSAAPRWRLPFCSPSSCLGPKSVLAGQLAGEMRTWRGAKVGTVGPSPALKAAVRALPRQSAAATAAAPR